MGATQVTTPMMKALILLCLAYLLANGETKGTCMLQADPRSTQPVKGLILFTQKPGQKIIIHVNISGLNPVAQGSPSESFEHGIHVHEFGDINGGCASAGGHYNPRGVNHGGPTADVRHPGDFGNLVQSPDGVIDTVFTDPMATMFGPESIIGRSIVLHAGQDDLGLVDNDGSRANGNAGAR